MPKMRQDERDEKQARCRNTRLERGSTEMTKMEWEVISTTKVGWTSKTEFGEFVVLPMGDDKFFALLNYQVVIHDGYFSSPDEVKNFCEHHLRQLIEKQEDDRAVDAFARAMKVKLAITRAAGRSGWHDKEQCRAQDLTNMLRECVEKGGTVDVGNFCAFLFARGERISTAPWDDAEATKAALIAFNIPTGWKFGRGSFVKKRSGSSWRGRVVGFYSASLTNRGYAVESSLEPGNVQVYPEAALEPWDGKVE